jgi:Tol biopolymer transport system component
MSAKGTHGVTSATLRLSMLVGVLVAGLLFATSVQAAMPRLALIRGGDIWTVAANGSDARQVTRGWAPAWSPDRKAIAFVRPGDGGRICTVPAAGGAVRSVAYRDALRRPEIYGISGLAYSPDGKKLAFADTYFPDGASFTHNRVVEINMKTHATRVLMLQSRGLDTSWVLSWSPNGKTLLVAQSGQSSEGGMTWLLDVASKRHKGLGIADASHADWSPDGKTILVSTGNQESTSVLVARPNGTVIGRLLEGGSWGATPDIPPVRGACYSVDGEQVAYAVTAPETGDISVWVMNADGSDRQRLTAGYSPAWR